jgi:hypothetical protein
MVQAARAELVRCQGCGIVVAVHQPPGVAFHMARGRAAGERERMTITVDRALVHECVRSLDGTWRVVC